jgi:pimeloyl-ACP methyl ester carboxylesterase
MTAGGTTATLSRVVTERDVRASDGRTLRAYDAGADAPDAFALFWHHGSPHTGVPIEPLVDAAASRGVRLITYARPSYGASTPQPGRDVAAAAADAAQVADAFGAGRFAAIGASGGGPHALACGALLGDRVIAVATLASPAPFTDEFDWFAGMQDDGALRAAREGRAARARFAETEAFDPDALTALDWAAVQGAWAALGQDAMAAAEAGPDGLIDDDVAFAAAWGFDPADIDIPVLVVHGGEDRMVPATHADALVRRCPRPELWLRPRDGHVSVLAALPLAMDWLAAAGRG